tara:strand:- start:2395 stop:2955 length:561 start_codon:yes stop_codon:yes gene_type:complete
VIFLKNYLNEYKRNLNLKETEIKKLIKIKNTLLNIKKKNKKILVFGNGGSAAISSHFAVDLTKNAKIRAVNFNEADLITCFSNDYGYENWIKKSIEYYHDKGDVIILISSSGKSKNIINAAKYAKKNKITLISFTGINKNNPLRKISNISIFIDSKSYNIVECIHQILILSIVDLIIGKSEYSSNL